jgi:hypothetical protein
VSTSALLARASIVQAVVVVPALRCSSVAVSPPIIACVVAASLVTLIVARVSVTSSIVSRACLSAAVVPPAVAITLVPLVLR